MCKDKKEDCGCGCSGGTPVQRFFKSMAGRVLISVGIALVVQYIVRTQFK